MIVFIVEKNDYNFEFEEGFWYKIKGRGQKVKVQFITKQL